MSKGYISSFAFIHSYVVLLHLYFSYDHRELTVFIAQHHLVLLCQPVPTQRSPSACDRAAILPNQERKMWEACHDTSQKTRRQNTVCAPDDSHTMLWRRGGFMDSYSLSEHGLFWLRRVVLSTPQTGFQCLWFGHRRVSSDHEVLWFTDYTQNINCEETTHSLWDIFKCLWGILV